MSAVTTLTKKNQITIPAHVARALSLAPRDRVLVEKQDGWIKATPLRTRSFVNLFGIVKSAKKPDYKKLRKQLERHVAERKR